MFTIVANQDTFLKQLPKQSSELTDTEKQAIAKDESFGIENIIEEKDGHIFAELQADSGKRWFFKDHWDGWTVSKIDYTDSEIDIMARTLYGEARGEAFAGKVAVAHCILNRVKHSKAVGGFWWGNSIAEVCKNPAQFSCWNKNDPNYRILIGGKILDKYFDECLEVVRKVLSDEIKDFTFNSDHYHVAAMKRYPNWANASKKTVTIDSHTFYRLYTHAPSTPISSQSENQLEAVKRQIERLSKYLPEGFELNLDQKTKYFSQRDNYRDSWRTCNSSSNAMFLDWLLRIIGKEGLVDGDDPYIKKVFSIGDTTIHEVQTKAITQYGFDTKWMTDRDTSFLKELVKTGFPIPVNILHKGTSTHPLGGHVILLIGRNDNGWIAHDPWGTLSSGYTQFNGAFSQISDSEFNARWQGGYRILA